MDKNGALKMASGATILAFFVWLIIYVSRRENF